MLQNILLKIRKWINDTNLLNDEKLNNLMSLLKQYDKGSYIYPGVIMREIDISPELTYKLIDILLQKGIVQMNYEIYCHPCNRFVGKIYETYSKVPEYLECDICGDELKRLENTIVVYKVIHDGTNK